MTGRAIYTDIVSTRRDRFTDAERTQFGAAAMFTLAVFGDDEIPADGRSWQIRTRHLTDPALDPEGIVAEGIAYYRTVVLDYHNACRAITEADHVAHEEGR